MPPKVHDPITVNDVIQLDQQLNDTHFPIIIESQPGKFKVAKGMRVVGPMVASDIESYVEETFEKALILTVRGGDHAEHPRRRNCRDTSEGESKKADHQTDRRETT